MEKQNAKNEKSKMKVLDKAELKKQSEEIVNAVTSDKFLSQLEAVWSSDEKNRLGEAAKRFSKEGLNELGIEIPNYTRISTRYFEENQNYQIDFGESAKKENILNLLNSAKPGLLDDLRVNSPKTFEQIVKSQNELLSMESTGGLCVCVGAVVCIGVGGDLATAMAERISLSK